ncbi:hypothetical protein EYF80_059536 [Liparis tanakae]|uniref:Uncharacterized protein n=1 Tax=Liparis tanakae TaxID=230148 RepID=A0A4Z2EPS4_9TELE|nr:hypothetical protein EYF80_059536 [Liparis tanakae]
MLKMSQKMRQTSSTFMMEGMAPIRAFTTTCRAATARRHTRTGTGGDSARAFVRCTQTDSYPHAFKSGEGPQGPQGPERPQRLDGCKV